VGQGPVFEILGAVDGVADFLEFGAAFFGGGDAPELLERAQIDREGIRISPAFGTAAKDEWVEGREAVDVFPDTVTVGVEEMGAVAVDDDAVNFFGVAISADVLALLEDEAFAASVGHLAGEDRAEEAGADDEVVVHFCNSLTKLESRNSTTNLQNIHLVEGQMIQEI